MLGVTFEIMFEDNVCHKPHCDCRSEEAYHFADCNAYSVKPVALVERNEEGKKHDADDVVEDCRRHDGSADFRVELSEFFESGNGDTDARSRQYRAVKEVGYDLMLRYVKSAVERRSDQKSKSQWEQNAQNRYQNGGKSACFELFEVGFQSCREHDEDDADFGKEGKPLHRGLRKYVLIRNVLDETEKYACNQHSNHLRKSDFLAQKGK